ncbi:MAG: VWA domain-containing protein [Dermatophilaceae bacterium]
MKDTRDWVLFSEIYERFFRLEPLPAQESAHDHDHGHGDLSDDLVADRVTLSQQPADTPQQGHDHGKPADIREYFDEQDLAASYNLHQDAWKVDVTSMTQQVVLATDQQGRSWRDGGRVQLETDQLHNAMSAGDLAASTGTRVDVDLSIAAQPLVDAGGPGDDDAQLRRRVDAAVADLPRLLKEHLERLARTEHRPEQHHADRPAYLERVSERDRQRLEEAIRRLARQLHGALTHRWTAAARGRVEVTRTMRRNLRHDGIPFSPVTVARKEDRPRLVVLADVSLSVRNSARFTLHLVHGLQRLFPRVRTFVFVNDMAEVTELFADNPLEAALGVIFDGGLVDVDGNSDYGRAFTRFVDEHLTAVTHRTSVVVLGDGRSNGLDPGLGAFESISRRARRVVWLTPEPRYSWALGRCDLPRYAELCRAVHVVRDVNGLDEAADALNMALTRPDAAAG